MPEESDDTEKSEEETETATSIDLDLNQVNEFLNTSVGMGPGLIANEVQVIPQAYTDEL